MDTEHCLMGLADRVRTVWEIPAGWRPTERESKDAHRPEVAHICQISRFWIAVGGILAGAVIAVVLRLPLGWWISALVVLELLHAIFEFRGGSRNVLASLFVAGTVIGLLGLLLRLPSYSGTSLVSMIVAAVVVLPPRTFGVVICYQAAWFHRATGIRRDPNSIDLGLPISPTLARLMKGGLTHRHDRGWSIFELTLPLVAEPGGHRSDGSRGGTARDVNGLSP